MFQKKPISLFLEDFNKTQVKPEEYEFISPYIASTAPITLRHKTCGRTFEVKRAGDLTKPTNRPRCPYCYQIPNTKISEEQIEEEVKKIGKGEFSLLKTEHVNSMKYILTLKHKVCDTTFTILRVNMMAGINCPTCSKDQTFIIRRNQEVSERIEQNSFGRYKLISDYTGVNDDIVVLDQEKDEELTTTYKKLKYQIKLMNPEADFSRNWLTQEIVEKRTEDDSLGRYKIVGPYEGYNESIKVLDTETGEIDEIKYLSLIRRIRRLRTELNL